MTRNNKIILTVSLLFLSYQLYRYWNKRKENKESEAKRKAELEHLKEAHENIIEDYEDRTEPDYFNEEEISPVIADFKTLINKRFPGTFKDNDELADKDFFDVLEPITGERKLQKCFLRNFNTMISRILQDSKTYELENTPIIDCDFVEKGGKGKEINDLKELINIMFDDTQLYNDGNYNKILYDLASVILADTGVFSNNDNDGKICKDFITNSHILITNIKS